MQKNVNWTNIGESLYILRKYGEMYTFAKIREKGEVTNLE